MSVQGTDCIVSLVSLSPSCPPRDSFWGPAPACHLEESPLHILVSEALDDGVEESRDQAVEQSQLSVLLWGGLRAWFHVHDHGWHTEHGDHSDMGGTGGEGLQPPLD